MVTHVLRELKFVELCNLGICGDQGFPKVVREIMVDILGGEPFLMYANLMDFSFASLLCCVLMYDYLSIYLYPFSIFLFLWLGCCMREVWLVYYGIVWSVDYI